MISHSSLANDRKAEHVTTNLSFKKILHIIQDELLENEQLTDTNYELFRKQEHDYVMSEIKKWEDLHKAQIKKLNQKQKQV